MDFALSEEQELLRSTIVRFAEQELSAGAAERDREMAFPRDLWLRCGEMGLLGLVVPEAYGGRGLDPLSAAIALEALGYGCRDAGLVFSLCAQLLSCLVPIWKVGNDAQRARYLPDLCAGRSIAVNAMTEPGSGSDAFALATRAVRDGDGYRLRGTKAFGTNGPVGDLFLVFAATDPDKGFHGGVTAFLVERDTPGVEVGPALAKLGLRTSPIGELVLDDVRVGDGAVLGTVGGGAALFTLSMDWERTCLFASHVGQIERMLEQTIAHARTRTQFGRAIGANQAVSHRIADMKVRLEAARLLVYRAAWRLERSKAASLDAAIAKLFTSESLVETARAALQIHAGYGYVGGGDVERALRDSLGSTIYSGTSEVQRNIIARWLGLPASA